MPGSNQRLFNRISGTIVVETPGADEPEGMKEKSEDQTPATGNPAASQALMPPLTS